jgi:acid phosphatase
VGLRWDDCKIGQDFEAAVASQTGQTTLKVRRFSELPAPVLKQPPTRSSHCYDGQLTDVGKQSTFRLGTILRDAYTRQTPLLPAVLSQDQLDRFTYFRSTAVPRAFESLQNVLAGFLGNTDVRPTILVRDLPDESLIPDLPSCLLHRQMKMAFKNLAHIQTADDLAALDPILEPLIGQKLRISSKPSAVEVWDAFRATRGAGRPLPAGVTEEVMQTLETAAKAEWFGGYRSEIWTKLAVGPLFAELDDMLRRKVAGKDETKLAVWSAHDTTISSILCVRGAYTFRLICP